MRIEKKFSFKLIKDIFILQLIIIFYTTSGIMAKNAAHYKFLSMGFLFYYGIEIVILGIYAIAWQQAIKKFDLSVAYSNRALSVLWSLIWAVLFFQEKVTLNNIIGVVIIVIGTMMVNNDHD